MVFSKKESTYSASMTREQFMFYEMKITAQLLADGFTVDEIVEHVITENLFQYPTEKSCKRMAVGCIRRLGFLSEELIKVLANAATDEARQICLYALMKQNRLVLEFMVNVIGEKYRTQNLHFTKLDVNEFFASLQEQNDVIASWSEATIKKLKSVLVKLLVDNEYLENTKAEDLQPVWLYPVLENSIREQLDENVLPAFNCFDQEKMNYEKS